MDDSIILQSGSGAKQKLVAKLSEFGCFLDFQKRVADEFRRELGGFVIANSDRKLVDSDEFQRMHSPEFLKESKANRLFLVLEHIDAPVEREVEFEISYMPHHNTLTKTGRANFSRLPDAVAELCDNSIQATNGNSGSRELTVEVQLGGTSFLVVSDNGAGMDAVGLQDLATYFRTQENRGQSWDEAQSGDNMCPGFLSKFGVGALQAGFFLGTGISVVTKCAGNPSVMEFALDEEKFEKRSEEGCDDVYRDPIYVRGPGPSPEDAQQGQEKGKRKESAENKLRQRLRAEEGTSTADHFTYIVITLRKEHVEWFTERDGLLGADLANIYHYYLHPKDCFDYRQNTTATAAVVANRVRDDGRYGKGDDGDRSDGHGSSDSSDSESEDEAEDEADQGGAASAAGGDRPPVKISYKQGNLEYQLADLEAPRLDKRFNRRWARKFTVDMTIPHREKESKPHVVQVVVNYYPFNGKKETRPRVGGSDDADASIVSRVFWQGRLVPESHVACLNFFPPQKLSKLKRDQLGPEWKSRVAVYLFFDWNAPISNNKLKMTFAEGDLEAAMRQGIPRDRKAKEKFEEFLADCHKDLDLEYRFDKEIISRSADSKMWREMVFGNGRTRFKANERVKLATKKPTFYGTIKHFTTKIDADGDRVKGSEEVCMMRSPTSVFGSGESASISVFPVTELDRVKSKVEDRGWNQAMMWARKHLPSKIKVVKSTNGEQLPRNLVVSAGVDKDKVTKIEVEILNGNEKPMRKIPHGEDLGVRSILERTVDGRTETVEKWECTKPWRDDVFGFHPMGIRDAGTYIWRVEILKGIESVRAKEYKVTVLPGGPERMKVELTRDNLNEPISLETLCYLPAFDVELHDAAGNRCPKRAFKQVTVSCANSQAFNIWHPKNKTATFEVPQSDSQGPVAFSEYVWNLQLRENGLLSAREHVTRRIAFEVTVHTEDAEFKDTFELPFEPGKPERLELSDDSGDVLSAEAGCSIPPFSLAAMDGFGNRTAPSANDGWQVELEMTANTMEEAEEPAFAGPAKEKVAAGAASFSDLVVEWDKILAPEGEQVMVDANLLVGGKQIAASTSFPMVIKPSKAPFRAIVCIGNNPVPEPGQGVPSHPVGSTISGLRLRLENQSGAPVPTDAVTFQTGKRGVNCSWDAAWRHPSQDGFDVLPDVKLPSKLEDLDGGLFSARVEVAPRALSGRTLEAEFKFAVCAGPATRWMAVRAGTGEFTDAPEPLVMTAGSDSNDGLASLAEVVKGFVTTDEYGNLVVDRATKPPQIEVEGLPPGKQHKLVPKGCKLSKPSQDGVYRFPRGFNLTGPPCDEGVLVIGDLRLPVALRAGPPTTLLVRSVKLGAPEYTRRISAMKPAGFEVTDLDFRLVDSWGNPASIAARGMDIKVDLGPLHLSALLAKASGGTMPAFSLVVKRQGKGSAAAAAAAQSREAVKLAVSAAGLKQQSEIAWVRERTNAVTKVHLATISPGPDGAIEEPRNGNLSRQYPVDGPLPTLLIWVDTDDGVGFKPSPDSLTLTATSESSGPLGIATAEAMGVPPNIDKPHALVVKPSPWSSKPSIGKLRYTCWYTERRDMPKQVFERGEEKHAEASMAVRIVAGAPKKLQPFPDDANLLESLSASNHDAKQARRLVDSTFRFCVSDCMGNVIKGSSRSAIKGPVRMRIADVAGRPERDMPRLEEANADGFVEARNTVNGLFFFEEISLEQGVGSDDGEYELVVDSENDPALASWSTKFRFDTDQHRVDGLKKLQREIEPLLATVDKAAKGLYAAQGNEHKAVQEFKVAASRLPEASGGPVHDLLKELTTRGAFRYEIHRSQLKEMMKEKKARKIELDRSAGGVRPLKFGGGGMAPGDEQKLRPFEYVAKLGYVDELKTAQLLSQSGGSKLEAVYVHTKSQMDQVRKLRLTGAFCKETTREFTVPGTRRSRNPQEMARKKLPLPQLKFPGFKGYLVNMIQLSDENEHLRDTVFFAIYGKRVVFDTYDNAHTYQVDCKAKRSPSLSIVIQEDGTVLDSTGYMPRANGQRSFDNLRTVFGATPVNLTPEYKEVELYIRHLAPLTEELQRVHKAKEALTKAKKADADCAAHRKFIAISQAKIKDLSGDGGNRGKRGRSSTGGASAAAAGGPSGAAAARRSTGKGPRRGGRSGDDGEPPSRRVRRR